MGWLSSVYSSLFGSVKTFSDETITEQVNAFRTFLNGGDPKDNPTVRMWAEAGDGYGRQASTANLVYRLARPAGDENLNFAYAGTIEIYYKDAAELAKLKELIPELLNDPAKIDEATLKAIEYEKAPADAVNFGFTGGAEEDADYTEKLNVKYFLRLRPYAGTALEQVQRPGEEPIDLGTVPQLGAGFNNRLFYLDEELYAKPSFASYADNARVEIVELVASDATLEEFQLLATYSVDGVSGLNAKPVFGAALITGAVMKWQDTAKAPKPVIILNLDDFGTDSVSQEPGLREILKGNSAPSEVNLSEAIRKTNREVQLNFTRRSKFFKDIGANARFTYLNYPTTKAAVESALNPLIGTKNKVIWIQLGQTPPPVFNYAVFRSTLPGLFEGQETATLTNNIGRPYMQAAEPNLTDQQRLGLYPSISLTESNASEITAELLNTATQISSSNAVWPEKATDAPTAIVGAYYGKYLSEDSGEGSIRKYFTDLKAYFAQTSKDKFAVSIAYLNSLRPAPPPPGLTLNELYEKLQPTVVIGQSLNLIPGILTEGVISKYVQALLAIYAPALTFVVEEFTHEGEPPDVTKITLSGPTPVFEEKLGVKCKVTVVFTEPDKVLTADLTFVNPDKWTFLNVPWIALRDPYINTLVPQGKLPVSATFGGYYPALESQTPPIEAKVEISVGAPELWPATITFAKTYPSISAAFQMATSINLVQRLPPPFNVLTDLGVSSVVLQYNQKKTTLESIVVVAKSNTPNLPLFGSLVLNQVEVSTTLMNPAGDSALSVTGSAEFTMGATEPTAKIGVSFSYPGLVLQGELKSGKITIENLFSTFVPGYQLYLPEVPQIDAFSFNYNRTTDYLNVTLNFNIQWTISFFGKDLFKIEKAGFNITRDKGVTTGIVTGSTVLLPASQKIGVDVSAFYRGENSWKFEAKQTSGVIDINPLLGEYLGLDWIPPIAFPKIDGLTLSLEWDKEGTAFDFYAKTATPWTPIPALPKVTVMGDLAIGYNKDGKHGTLGADLTLWSINLRVDYNFDPKTQNLCVKWLFVKACLTKDNTTGDTLAVFTLDDKSIGEMVSMFVSWATGAEFGLAAPWNLLNDIKLNGFSVTYNFTKETVKFSVKIGPIDFGLFKITSIGLNYDPSKPATERRVQIDVEGTFVWESGKDSLSWDPTKPEETPAPPGGGNKYLDLRLIALGQHVTVQGLTDQKNVQDVIKMLRDLKVPEPPEIPVGGSGQPVFRPDSAWFVGLDFGVLKVEEPKSSEGGATAVGRYTGGLPAVMKAEPTKPPVYFIQLSIVFNDPVLYALRIALDGPMAKVFAGLDFQIMYRQVTDTVGCYSAQIALPNIMRKFQIGVATITLPVFAIEVYTNGDFQVDIGFPWNMDFSRSFGVEAIIPPGIPVTGAGGFYFGKLSSATTNKVPTVTNGWFNPVIVFGFGVQLGLGKSIEAGILRAGFSLTVIAIIEGVVARFLPYNEPTQEGNPNNLQDGYYFALTGTAGVQGRLYGSIDFAIIKADVDVSISIYIRFTFIAYEDITIAAGCQVKVKVSVKIDLGLFSISISFSFSATIEATFVLQNPMGNNPPWHVAKSFTRAALTMSRRRRVRGVSSALLASGISPAVYNPVWSNLQKGPSTLEMSGWVMPVLTVAGDTAKSPGEQKICYAVNFFLPVLPPVHAEAPKTMLAAGHYEGERPTIARAALHRASVKAENATFEDFAVLVLQWVLAAGIGPMTAEQLNSEVVTRDFLTSALAYLSGATTPTPVPAGDIDTFLSAQTEFLFSLNSAKGSSDAAFFPAPPATTLDVPAFPPSGKHYNYAFATYNSSDSGYLEFLTKYFNELKVQVEKERQKPKMLAVGATGPSIGSYIFGDYFALIGRQTIQALIDGLANFKLVIDSTLTVQGIVEWVNNTGQLSGDNRFTAEMLFHANSEHRLSQKPRGPLTIAGMTWQTPGGLSFDQIAGQSIFGGKFNGKELAKQNAANARILGPGITISHGAKSVTTTSGDSLETIAAALGFANVDELLNNTTVVSNPALIALLSVVTAPPFPYTIAANDTLASVAAHYAVTTDLLAEANLGVAGLFDTADPNLNVPELSQFQVGALIDEAKRVLALQDLSSMASRFYLDGLRLPTDGLTANADGLLVTGSPGNYKYPKQLGLFALTGQAFPLPDNIGDQGAGTFSFTLTRGSDEGWLSFTKKGDTTLQFQLTDKDDIQRYQDVRNFALKNSLATGMSAITPLDTAQSQPSSFPLSQQIIWQTPAVVTLPRQKVTPANPQPALWPFPDSLVNLPHSTGPQPRLKAVIARTDAATGATVNEDVANYGFGNLVNFTIRRTAPVAGAPATDQMYEIVGATERDIVLLERLLDQLGGSSAPFASMTLLYQPPTTGSQPVGWQSAGPATSLMGISQVNLSTETRPPAAMLALALAAAPETPNVINSPNEFLRLLWEASITRSGGFYLTWVNGVGSNQLSGLPDNIFDDSNTAAVAILSLFKADANEGQAITNYTNVLATNQPFDLSDAALIALGVPVMITTAALTATDTLAALAALYYTDPSLIAESNSGAVLTGTVTVTGGMYEVGAPGVAPGGKLADIAKYFATTEVKIKEANPNRKDWPDPLPQYTGLSLPSIDVRIGTDPGGKTFSSLADYYHTSIANIAAANLFKPGLITTGTTLTFLAGPLTVAPLIQAGVAGFHTFRTAPDIPQTPTDAKWGEAYLLQIFNLLGYRVPANANFRESLWGLPGGPADPSGDVPKDKITAIEATAAGDRWDYTRTAPYWKLYSYPPQTKNGDLPAPTDSPYLGAGQLLQFELTWQDLFGNLILSDLSEPQNASQKPLNQAPQIPGYTDRLIPTGQWPAVANAFLIKLGGNQKPVLELHLSFDESQYTGEDAEDRINRALTIYSQIIWQLTDPNGVAITLTTTVTPGAGSVFSDANKTTLTTWVDDIYLWLQSLIKTPSNPYPLNPDLVITVALDETKLNTDQIFQVTAYLTLTRNAALVAGDLSTVSAITSASTSLAPWTGGLEADSQKEQREISAFAEAFTGAFVATPGITYHIATGSDRDAFTSSGQGGLWAVQLGDRKQSKSISYTVTNPGAPLIYAPRPVSNKLASKARTPIIPYQSGQVINLNDPVQYSAFNNIDLDQWLSFAATNIDALLTTRYVAPAAILRNKTGNDSMQKVLNAKKALAAALQHAMIPVFKGQTATDPQKKAIQKVFYETMLGQVSQFYAVKAGIQFDTQVNSALPKHAGETDPPRLYGEVTGAGDPNDLEQRNLSLSSPKLNLKFAGSDDFEHYLSLLLSSTSSSATVSLNLGFRVNNIEHEIGKLKGIDGYQPSSWLSFADDTQDAKWPLNEPLGQFDVPIVLRAFPETPALVRQEVATDLQSACYTQMSKPPVAKRLSATAEDCNKPGTYNPLAGAALWNYGFEYSQQVHYLQDEIHGEIRFNTKPSGLKAFAAEPRDLFDNLAEFVQEYPKVRADLDSYLAPLTVGTTNDKQIAFADTALQSAAVLIQWIADTANVFSAPKAGLQAALVESYPFTITETETDKVDPGNKPVKALAIVVALPAPPPSGVGNPLVLVEPEIYDCEPDGGEGLTRRFVYKNKNTGFYLTSEEGRTIAGRTFILPDLDVLERQSAQSVVYLTRNRILAGKPIADIFVYTTPEVSFPDPLLPTLTVDKDIDLATIFATDPNTPVKRSLECQLSCLYQVLFEHAGTETVTLALTAYYEFTVFDQLSPVRLPVLLMPPLLTAIRSGGGGTPLADVIAKQASGVRNWFDSLQPQQKNARLWFELTIMSNLTARPMPVLKLTKLYLALVNIQPPL